MPQDAASDTKARLVSDQFGVLTTRAQWPVGVPLRVDRQSEPFEMVREQKVSLQSTLVDAPVIEMKVGKSKGPLFPVLRQPAGPPAWSDGTCVVGVPTSPREGIEFTFAPLDRWDSTGDPSKLPISPLVLPVVIKGTVDDVLTGVSIPEIDAAIKKKIDATLYRNGLGSHWMPRLLVRNITDPCDGILGAASGDQSRSLCAELSKHPDVTFAVRFELYHDSRIFAVATAWCRAVNHCVSPSIDALELMTNLEPFRSFDPNDGKWTLRIRSDPVTALRDFATVKYWKGEVEIPLAVEEGDRDPNAPANDR
ncbi:MAG: hypothetical protein JSR77_17620 [Planctomycetes bacterium]|nr:hypothetical protein [Planctomycetota bacterium]